jgi:hypothetical protein
MLPFAAYRREGPVPDAPWSAVVAYYRLYFLTPDEHIESVQELEFPDDRQALAFAEQFRRTHTLELWSGNRLVAQLGRFDAGQR